MQRIVFCGLVCVLRGVARAITPDAAQKLMKDVSPSLVAVQYTYDGELGRREFVGAGLVVSGDGMIITSISLTPAIAAGRADEGVQDHHSGR